MKTNGPGKYDEECALVMGATRAVGVLLVVIEGEHGNGISFKSLEPDLMRTLPAMLEMIARQMRADAQAGAN
jgi:hypothetical protein